MCQAQMRVWALLLGLVLLLLPFGAVAQQNPAGGGPSTEKVVTLGDDLTPEQRVAMLRVFGLTAQQAAEAGIPLLTVTNAEERAMLADSVPSEAIGSRAVSSALVERRPAGEGISVERYNITYVTDAMYGNALVTGGVRDARVVVAAPMNVSGTAALTGVFKAFEQASGKQLPPQAKATAGQELVTTGQLGEEIGNKDKAAELVARVKERVASDNLTDPDRVREIVVKVAGDLHIKLTTEQIEKVTAVGTKVAELNLRASDLRGQVASLRQQLNDLAPSADTRNLLQRLLDFLSRLFSQFFTTIVGLVDRLR